MKVVSVVSLSVLVLSGILCIPAWLNDDFAKAYTLFSNLAYIAPLSIAYVLKSYDFVLILSLICVVSSLYHACKAYDVCFRLMHVSWEYIDVQFSWFLLLTLAAYLAFPKSYKFLNPVNVLILIWSHEAHCQDSYECRNAKLVYLSIYFIVGIVKATRDREFYHGLNAASSLVFFVLASGFYLFGASDANHSAWHVSSAIGISLSLTMLHDAKFHFFGLVDSMPGSDEEKKSLIREDLRIYY